MNQTLRRRLTDEKSELKAIIQEVIQEEYYSPDYNHNYDVDKSVLSRKRPSTYRVFNPDSYDSKEFDEKDEYNNAHYYGINLFEQWSQKIIQEWENVNWNYLRTKNPKLFEQLSKAIRKLSEDTMNLHKLFDPWYWKTNEPGSKIPDSIKKDYKKWKNQN